MDLLYGVAQGAGADLHGRMGVGESGTMKVHSAFGCRKESRSSLVDRRRMGIIFQDYRLLPHKTAYENIAFALEASGAPEEDIERDVPQVLDIVGLTDKSWHFPGQLSGGEKQRVAIARAIVSKPDVVIADEPTGNLDPVNTHEIINLLQKINDLNGTIVILATHDKEIINSLKRRVVTLDKGKLVRDEERGKYVL